MRIKRTISYLLTFLLLICFVLPGTGYAADQKSDSSKDLRGKVEEKVSETSDDKKVQLTFSREDEDGDPLAGSVITVYDDDDEKVWKGKTNKKGVCTWENPKDGEYSFKETKAPAGEKRLKKTYFFVLEDGLIDEDSELTFDGFKVEVVLDDEDENDVGDDEKETDRTEEDTDEAADDESAEDADTKEESNAVEAIFSFALNGSSDDELELREGPSYVAREPDILEDDVEAASNRSGSSEDILVVITNTAQDGKDNDRPIENAEFTIYDESNKVVYKGLTDENGELQCYLPVGEYTFEQTYTPDGFKSAGDDLSFTVYENGKVVGDTEIVSQPGSDGPSGNDDGDRESSGSLEVDLVIANENAETGNAVIGAEVSVENSDGKVVAKAQSDKEGKATIDRLDPGDYEIYQSAAAAGYYKSSERLEIAVDEDGKITGDMLTLKSTPQGTVVITVVDKKTGGVIEGVGLSISNESGDVLATGKTNAKGTFAFVVPDLGKYRVKETSVPGDYTLNSSSYTFTVGEGFEINGTTTIENSSASSGRASGSTAGSYNSPGSSNSGTGSNSGDATTVDSEGVPQTGVADYTVPLVVVSIVLLIIAISAIILEWRRPDLLKKIFSRKGGISHGNNS